MDFRRITLCDQSKFGFRKVICNITVVKEFYEFNVFLTVHQELTIH